MNSEMNWNYSIKFLNLNWNIFEQVGLEFKLKHFEQVGFELELTDFW